MNILQIGDSHSVLAYGVELRPPSCARSPARRSPPSPLPGSSPMLWVTGYTAKTTGRTVPFLMIRPDGSQDLVPSRQRTADPEPRRASSAPSPRTSSSCPSARIQRWQEPRTESPTTWRTSCAGSDEELCAQCHSTARSSCAGRLLPPARTDIMPRATYEAFQAQLAAAVGPYGQVHREWAARARITSVWTGPTLPTGGATREASSRTWARKRLQPARARDEGAGPQRWGEEGGPWTGSGFSVGSRDASSGSGSGVPGERASARRIGYGVGRTLT